MCLCFVVFSRGLHFILAVRLRNRLVGRQLFRRLATFRLLPITCRQVLDGILPTHLLEHGVDHRQRSSGRTSQLPLLLHLRHFTDRWNERTWSYFGHNQDKRLFVIGR